MARWQPGQSGHPAGRPPGAVGKATAIRAKVLDDLPGILDGMVRQAQDGDVQAARMLCELALPKLKPVAEPIQLTAPAEGATLAQRGEAIVQAMAEGSVSPDLAHVALSALASQARLVEIVELEQRVARLEQNHVGI